MIPRYSRPEMANIWSPETKFRIWFEIEAHAAEAMAGPRADCSRAGHAAPAAHPREGGAGGVRGEKRIDDRDPRRENVGTRCQSASSTPTLAEIVGHPQARFVIPGDVSTSHPRRPSNKPTASAVSSHPRPASPTCLITDLGRGLPHRPFAGSAVRSTGHNPPPLGPSHRASHQPSCHPRRVSGCISPPAPQWPERLGVTVRQGRHEWRRLMDPSRSGAERTPVSARPSSRGPAPHLAGLVTDSPTYDSPAWECDTWED